MPKKGSGEFSPGPFYLPKTTSTPECCSKFRILHLPEVNRPAISKPPGKEGSPEGKNIRRISAHPAILKPPGKEGFPAGKQHSPDFRPSNRTPTNKLTNASKPSRQKFEEPLPEPGKRSTPTANCYTPPKPAFGFKNSDTSKKRSSLRQRHRKFRRNFPCTKDP